jgi:hypothetical protein
MKSRGRLNELRRQKQEILDTVKYFCLTPNLSDFRKVIESDFKAKDPENFYAWRTAALYKYSIDWGLEYDPGNNKLLTDEDFLELDNILVKNLQAPIMTKSMQTLYVFFATGELKYIDLFYQILGTVASNGVRTYLSDVFKATRSEYSEKIFNLLARNKNHLEIYDVKLENVDFSHFDAASIAKYKEIVENKKLAKNAAKDC